MARTKAAEQFNLYHQTRFETNINGYHIYISIWTPKLQKILKAKHDTRKEAAEFNEYAIGIYTVQSARQGWRKAVVGKCKHKVGLVVPTKFIAFTDQK